MDPVTALGVAANAFQLAELAAEVFIGVFQYCRNVKGAPAQAQGLRNELQNLSVLLDSLKKNLEVSPPSPPRANFLGTPAKELENLLLHMRDRVKHEKTKGLQRLMWPFTEKENGKLVAQLQRHKADLILALNVDQT